MLELEEILEDPSLKKLARICSLHPQEARGEDSLRHKVYCRK